MHLIEFHDFSSLISHGLIASLKFILLSESSSPKDSLVVFIVTPNPPNLVSSSLFGGVYGSSKNLLYFAMCAPVCIENKYS